MPTLASLQRDFMTRLYEEAPAPDRGLEVYRRNLRSNLGEALAATFPVVKRLVGDAFFRGAGERFLRERPSHSGDLHAYGEAFPAFLERDPHARELGYLADVARLEWARERAFHAADAQPFDFAALAALDAPRRARIRLHLHASVRLVNSASPIVSIWEANQADRDGTLERAWAPECGLVYREGMALITRAIDRAERFFLEALAAGTPLEDAVESLPDAQDLDRQLFDWIRCGVIERFSAA